MIVFTNTRNEETVSLSLNFTQIFLQNYSYSPTSNQFYNIGPRGVAVSIGACGDLLGKGRSKKRAFAPFGREALIDKERLQIALGLGSNARSGVSKSNFAISSLALGNPDEGPFSSRSKFKDD